MISDIVSVTGDGAPVMVSFGKILKEVGIHYLICCNHTINLAVTGEIFTKKIEVDDEELQSESESECEPEYDVDEQEHHDDQDDDADVITELFEMEPDYNNTIKRMRAVNTVFRCSPLKAGFLTEIMRDDGVKVLKLIADVPTRWNSLALSGKRFLQILPSIIKALNHRKIKAPEMWSDADTVVLKVNKCKYFYV